jgi:hypothetical protein
MKDGQLYVNMSFARSGTLILGGLNNVNGYLEVQDSTGRAIGTWGKDGINIFQGEISGPNITIGGLDNRNGIIQILDENGDMVGQIDGTGMFLTNSGETVKLNNEALAFYSNGVYLGAIIRNNRTAGISLESGANASFAVAGNQAYISATELYVSSSGDLPQQAYTGPLTIETPAGTHYLEFVNGILVV